MLSASCKKPPPVEAADPPMAVRTVAVGRGPVTQTLRYVGTVHSRNEVHVMPRISGKLSDLPLGEAERAERGAILARIAAPEADARVSRVQADLARVKEESAFLCRQAAIDVALLGKGAISEVHADASRQKCDSAQAGLNAARAGVRELDAVAGNAVERAPFSGTVLKWLSEPGENVMPGKPLLLFGDHSLEVRIRVHEKDILAGIGEGTVVLLQPDQPAPVRGTVARVSPLAAGPGRMVEVRVPIEGATVVEGRKQGAGTLDGAAGRFRHGMSVDVAFVQGETQDSLTVSAGAIRRQGSTEGVYVVRDDKAVWTAIATSVRQGGLVAVEGRLEAGDQIVVGNLEAVKDGLALWPIPVEGNAP
jgi:RND family efflux transporter MFP subunit